MKYDPFVITISRQLGSGGAHVGQKLAEKLDILYADREIITRAAKQLSVAEENLENRDEKISSFWDKYFKSNAMGATGEFIMPVDYIPADFELFDAETDVIKHISTERSAVIIGRCGAHILREHPNHFSIFLHASKAFRKDRVQEFLGLSAQQAEKMIVQSDRERAKYHVTFTKEEWTDARLYDISLDTGKIGLDACTELLIGLLEKI